MKEKRGRTPFGGRLYKARTHAKLTQAELGRAAGLSQGTIAELEYDGFASKSTPQLAAACGVRAEWLANEDGEMVDNFTWPFPRVARERILALTPDDRAFVEGKLSSAMEEVEPPSDDDVARFASSHRAKRQASKKKRSGS